MASSTESSYTLETIYAGAVEQIKDLQDKGNISQAEVDLITRTTTAQQFFDYTKGQISSNASLSVHRSKTMETMQALLLRIKGFESALDMLAQSSPQILGINIVGLIWGTLKFVIAIAQDVIGVFEEALAALEGVTNALPAMSTYISIFGGSELQLLRRPLITIYAQFVIFGLQAVKLFNRSSLKTLGQSALESLKLDIQTLITRTEVARREVDSLASIEHMHQTYLVNKAQLLENQKAEEFRQSLQLFFESNSLSPILTQRRESAMFIDAPKGLLSAYFGGRDMELLQLDTFFQKRSDYDIQRYAIYGMPGVGKTQVALKYAISHWPSRYAMVFWLPANTTERLNQGFANILNLVGHVDRNHPEQPARLTSARRWLEDCRTNTPKSWLLMVDNVNKDTVSFLRENLPHTSHGGDTLFTTRTENVGLALAQSGGHKHNAMALKPPSAGDAARLLLRNVEVEESAFSQYLNQAVRLVESIGCLPLAVDQAACFMKQKNRSLDDLLSFYRSEHKAQLIGWQNELSTYEQQSIAATFNLQLDDLEQLSPSASSLMNILSFLDFESIPIYMITKATKAVLVARQPSQQDLTEYKTPTPRVRRLSLQKLKRTFNRRSSVDSTNVASRIDGKLLESMSSSAQLDESIQVLHSLSLIDKQQSGYSSDFVAIRIHDLVQHMVQERSRLKATSKSSFQSAVSIVCGAFLDIPDPSSYECWTQSEAFIPHIQALTKHSDIFGDRDSQLISANIAIAGYFRARGRYTEAEALFQEVLLQSEKELGSKDPRTLQAMQDVASVHKSQGRYKEAEALLRKVMDEQKATLGRSNPHTLRTAQRLAIVCMELGNYEEAVTLSERTLARVHATVGYDHPEALRATQNLASIYEKRGNLDEAEDLYKQAYSGREKLSGPAHPDTQRTLHNLAVVYSRQGRFDEAEPLYEQALEWRKKRLGLTHPDTLSTLQNLALVCYERGDNARALSLGIEALTGRRTQLGNNHLETLQSAQNVAMFYERQDDFAQAEELYKTALAEFEKQLTPNHPKTLRIVHNLAYCYERQKRLPEAKALYQRAFTGRCQKLGPKHPDTLRTEGRLTKLLTNAGLQINSTQLN